ncbi:tripartite motif-containing protein 16-like [Archocentrus centrarchus]|uniref:tripartite motif-containing protein 16-like n=1 Tax=Archocentrus centrarchus TaxID=63155 RepID=UPI0011EA127C|nr:tripartite motif-containing protein 16-like [Archocentrus centrarchus]
MAQKGVQLDQDTISCSICLDLLKDPVTIPCGHSYCMNCIKTHFDGEDGKGIHSCPQCRKIFTPRPVLVKNIILAALVEQLKKTELQAAPADHCYAQLEYVACDICTGRKMKAIKSCVVCLISYCEKHIRRHYGSPAFNEHKLINPYSMKTELKVRRLNIQQRIQDREKDVKLFQQEVEAINGSADKAVEDSEKMLTELIRLIQKRSSDVKQQVRSQQVTEVSRVKELQEKLEQEIAELKRKDAELEQLSHTEDHNQFLHNYPSLSALSESTHSSSINIRPLRYFEDVTAAVSETTDKLQDILREEWTNISLTVTEVDVLLSPPEPKTRAGFLKYSHEITLDPNTAHTQLLLSEGNRKVSLMEQQQSYSDHPDRFTGCYQVLSRESLTGRCYWEVVWRGRGVCVALTYKDISRDGESYECVFGRNDKSWSLCCDTNSCAFYFNKVRTLLSGSQSSRVGVYLDHGAGGRGLQHKSSASAAAAPQAKPCLETERPDGPVQPTQSESPEGPAQSKQPEIEPVNPAESSRGCRHRLRVPAKSPKGVPHSRQHQLPAMTTESPRPRHRQAVLLHLRPWPRDCPPGRLRRWPHGRPPEIPHHHHWDHGWPPILPHR